MATKTFKIGLSDSDKATMSAQVQALVEKDLIGEYNSSNTYNQGDYCVYGSPYVLYRCKTNGTTGTWDSSKWEQATLQDLIDDVNDAVASVDSKANVDGNYPTMSVGHADSSASIDTEVGNNDQTPFNYQTSGGSADLETGMQKLNKLVGVDIVKNQWVKNPTFSSSSNWSSSDSGKGTIAIADNELIYSVILVGNSYDNGFYQTLEKSFDNHLVLVAMTLKSSRADVKIGFDICNVSDSGSFTLSTSYQTFFKIITADAGGNLFICTRGGTEVGDTISCKEVAFIDLTQRYGSNDVVNAIIGASNQVANLLKFDNDLLNDTSYDTGTLVNSKSAKLKTVGYNQFAGNSADNPQYVGDYYISNTFEKSSNSSYRMFRIKCQPSTTYCFLADEGTISSFANTRYVDKDGNLISGTFSGYNQQYATRTTPTNCAYIEISMSKSYTHNACVFLYWDGSKITYEPYEEHEYDLPNKDQHGILKVSSGKVVADGDELYPDGSGKTRYAVVDLSTLSWSTIENYRGTAMTLYYASLPSTAISSSNNPIISTKYIGISYNQMYSDPTLFNKRIAINSYSTVREVCILDTDLTSSSQISGTLVYGKEETELSNQGAFSENIFVDDFGTMQFLKSDNSQINGLQGAEIFYKANIAGFAESLYVKTDGSVDDLVVQSELGAVSTRIPVLSGEDGTYVLKATKSGTTITYGWVKEN